MTPRETGPGAGDVAVDRARTPVADLDLLGAASRLAGATTRRGRVLTLVGIGATVVVALLLLSIVIGTSDLGSSGVIVMLLVAVLAAQALIGLVVLLQARAVRAHQRELHRVRGMLERRTDRLLNQGRKAAQGRRALLRDQALVLQRLDALDRAETRHHLDTQRQVQALLNLERLVTVPGRVPPMGGWAASADLMVLILDEVIALRPRTVVECGSGTSTLLLALAARQHGLDTRIVALEHLEQFGAQTEATLARHGVADRAEVRLAPLTTGTVAGHSTPWYDESAVADLHDIGVLVVDGPPTATGELARYPAIPLLRDRLAPDAVIIMDDLIRESDQRVADLWRELLPDFSYELVTTLEKQAGVFRRTSETIARSRSTQ